MTPNEPPTNDEMPDFGEPMDLDDLLQLAELDEADMDASAAWWDEHASNTFKGALDG